MNSAHITRIVPLAALAAALAIGCGGSKSGAGDDTVDASPPGIDAMGACDAPGQLLCGASCADTNTDEAHCGSCDNVCGANQSCISGICACESPNITCTDGAANICVNPITDPEHCGGCDRPCLINTTCSQGVCGSCDAPNVVCTDTCADLTSDENHCGQCNNACIAGATCTSNINGIFCACPASDPVECPSGCSDLTTDANNCGACGTVCAIGAVCEPVGAGVGCVCSDPNAVMCPDVCANLANDPNNCGACGEVCLDGATCQSGACVCPSVGDIHCSGVGCSDLTSNTDACGSCSIDCQDGLQTCTNSACECAPGVPACPGFGGPCNDILSDPKDCGTTCNAADGNSCNKDEYCSGGSCVCRPELTNIAGNCINTLTDPATCGPLGGPFVNCAGQKCQDGVCVAACAGGAVDCGGDTCIDLMTDNRNCGGCGDDCGEDKICVAGNCERYRTTGDCASCPCDRCGEVNGGNSICCQYGTDPICIEDVLACP